MPTTMNKRPQGKHSRDAHSRRPPHLARQGSTYTRYSAIKDPERVPAFRLHLTARTAFRRLGPVPRGRSPARWIVSCRAAVRLRAPVRRSAPGPGDD